VLSPLIRVLFLLGDCLLFGGEAPRFGEIDRRFEGDSPVTPSESRPPLCGDKERFFELLEDPTELALIDRPGGRGAAPVDIPECC